VSFFFLGVMNASVVMVFVYSHGFVKVCLG